MCKPKKLSIKELRQKIMEECAGPSLHPYIAELVARSSHDGKSRIECHIADLAERVASLNMHRITRFLWHSSVASRFSSQRIRLDRALGRYIVRDWRLYHKCDSLCTDSCATVCTSAEKLCHLCENAPVAPSTAPELTPGYKKTKPKRMIMPSQTPEGQALLRQIDEFVSDPPFYCSKQRQAASEYSMATGHLVIGNPFDSPKIVGKPRVTWKH